MRYAMMTGVILLGSLQLVQLTYAQNITFNCEFSSFADPSGLQQEEFGFRIMYDDVSGNAFVVGNIGMSPATPASSDFGLTFTETTLLGGVMTTTIALDGSAVHSRHTYLIDGPLIPSQHYGNCTSSRNLLRR